MAMRVRVTPAVPNAAWECLRVGLRGQREQRSRDIRRKSQHRLRREKRRDLREHDAVVAHLHRTQRWSDGQVFEGGGLVRKPGTGVLVPVPSSKLGPARRSQNRRWKNAAAIGVGAFSGVT